MPVNFPSNPSLNQTYTFTNTTWKWNGIGWEIVYNTRQTGATGATGISGAPGSPGGATGATGPAGPAGSPGGATGATGPAGTPGTIGIDGATGATGPQGPSGSPGSPGGATGATGAQGATGSPGTPGGATGATGAPGPAGSGANVAVRDEGNLVVAAVSSLNFVGAGVAATATGSNVTITISATGNSQFYYTNVAPTNATIGDRWLDSETLKEFVYADVGAGPQWIEPAGDGGFVGATGPTGAAGSQGATGATGTGATGATGTAGTPGTAGATGATGTAGTPGTAGATGATGTAGTPGSAGSPGTAGATGATGTAGTPGIAGATGATGIGTTGATGAQGATGPAGTSANISVFDEGNLVTASVSGINFVGPGITANLVSGNVQVSVTATGTGTGGFNFSNAAPATPTVGDRWLNSETLTQYVYINDGDSSQWVEPITRAASSNLTNVSTHILPNSNVTYDLGSSSLRWRDLYLSGNSIILGGATLTASGSAIALPAGSTVGGQNLATGSDVSTGGGPKITNLQVTSNVYVVLDDTAVDTVGGFIKLTGTNFVTGCMVYVGTVPANSTTFVNSTEVRAQLPATAAGTYPVYVVNPDGGTAIRVPGVTFSASPAWQTASNLGEQYDGVLLNLSVVATDATSYTLVSGSLPPGLSLNSNSGVISGTVTGVTNDTVYSFTINAVDPQLQDSPRTFTVTITVSDPYFKLTTLLLSGSAVSANTVVRDSSTNNFNLTVYGDARASNFTPYGGAWSNYFSTGKLTVAQNAAFNFGTGNFTIECWINVPNTTVQFGKSIVDKYYWSGVDNGWLLTCQRNSAPVHNLAFYMVESGGAAVISLSYNGTFTTGIWHHVAVTRSGTAAALYFNGNIVASQSSVTGNDNYSSALYVGSNSGTNATNSFDGYISNLRIIKGQALFTGNFSPANSALSVSSVIHTGANVAASITGNVVLLTSQDNRLLDNSPNSFSFTKTNTVNVTSYNPFNITNTGVNGSIYLDGTGDYVTTPTSQAPLALDTANFTLECWVYFSSGQPQTNPCILSSSVGSSLANTILLQFGTQPSTQIALWVNNVHLTASATNNNLVFNAWNHIAVCRTGGSTYSFFINGIAVNSVASNSTSLTANDWRLGYWFSGAHALLGYITDFRIIKGTALYSSNFTPPTAPLTAVTNTQLLTFQYDQPHNNHTFLDSSSNQFLITRSGNATQGTFSPFSLTGWAAVFDGNGDYLTIGDNAAFDFGTGDVTWECWIYMTGGDSSTSSIFSTLNNGVTTNGYSFHVSNNTSLILHRQTTADGGNNTYVIINYTFTKFVWYHVAYVRNSGVNAMYVNGIAQSLSTNTFTSGYPLNSDFTMLIGGNANTSYRNWFSGYISNLRLLKGTALYTANFTPSTSTLTTIANTSLLTCHVGAFRDSSTNNFSIGVNGDVRVSTPGPFPTTAVYNPVIHGGSAYFDGTGDSLAISSTNAFTYGTAAFTIEAWVYSTGPGATRRIYHQMNTGSNQVTLLQTSANKINAFINLSGVAFCDILSVNNLQAYAWNHVAFVRSGNNFALFINGIREGTASSASSAPDTGATVYIGTLDSSEFWLGYISNLRAIKGVAVYDPTQTTVPVPTAPVTATTNTSLLLNFTDAAILDSTGRTVLETVADAKSSSVVTKFTGGSMYFDGAGDAINIRSSDLLTFGTGDWTVEFWVYHTSVSGQQTYLGDTGGATSGPYIYKDSSHKVGLYYSSQILTGTTTIAINTWYYIVLSRSSGTVRLFINGIQETSASDTTNLSVAIQWIGGDTLPSGYLSGYMNDIRVTKGYARYTANFTAPTVPARLK